MKSRIKYSLKKKTHNFLLFNVVLWICSFIILLIAFVQDNKPAKIDYIYTGSFLVTIIIPVMINMYVLIPLFLKKEKYLYYFVCFTLNLLFFTQLNIWYFGYFVDFLFPDYYFISYHSNTKLITIFSIFLIITTFIKLSENWFYLNRNENRELKLKNQQIQSELISLRSQINPHFLFNSLNVIYALALEKKEETTKAIVQLSDILRYVIYDSNTEKVALEDEIVLLKNYIQFQKYRHNMHCSIDFKYDIDIADYQIYPMLLLPLVENSFKHGFKSDIKDSFININLSLNKNEFNFMIENSYNENSSYLDKASSGLGIENIQKNLEIVYKNKHLFKVLRSKDKFTVSLKLFDDED